MKNILTLVLLALFCAACNSIPTTKSITKPPSPKENSNTLEPEQPTKPLPPATPAEDVENFSALQFNVALGISAQRPRWVLFKNGTYVIFPEGYTDTQIEESAKEMVGTNVNENMTFRKSSLAKGWIGSTSNGIYTYVSADDLGEGIVDQQDLKAQGIKNLRADKSELRVIYINSKKN